MTFRENPDGSLVCEHRDLSVCPKCAALPDVVEVCGAHFLMNAAERAAFALEVSCA
jgi:hypothetical protein